MATEHLTLQFVPHPGQVPVLQALHKARFITMIAGIRSGKTYLGRQIALWWATNLGGPGNKGVIVAQDFRSGVDNIIDPILLEWPESLIAGYNKQDHRLTLTTGHKIILASAENPDSMRGLSDTAWWWMDEAALHPQKVHLVLLGRGMDLRAPGLITTTPKYGPGVIWLKKVFQKGLNPLHCGDDVEYHLRYFSHNMGTWDNPYVPIEEKPLLLDGYSGAFYEQEIMGRFVDDGMLVFVPEILTPERCGYYEEDIAHLDLTHYLLVDPAFSESDVKTNSESAVLAVGVGPEYGVFIRESWADRVDSHKLEQIIMHFQAKYAARSVGCERVSAQIVLIDNLRRAQRLDQTFPIIELARRGGQDNKRTRAMTVVPFLQNRLLKFPIDEHGNFLHGTQELVDQMLVFTGQKGELNDRVDTLSDVFNIDMGIVEGVHRDAIDYRRKRDPAFVPLLSQDDLEKIEYGDLEECSLSLN